MRTYQLTATLADKTELVSFIAYDDSYAMESAIPHVLDEAYYDKLGPWSKGLIELTNPEGDIIAKMDAKS